MLTPDFFIIYVNDPEASGAFYTELLKREPVLSSPTFIMFSLESGMKLGIWSQHTVEPPYPGRLGQGGDAGGGCELTFPVDSKSSVDALYAQWSGSRIAQSPVEMDFGYTFVALDPDGHRLRFYHPNQS